MKAVVGEEALSSEELGYIDFLENFEKQFISQGRYENRTIFQSLDSAWELLRKFEKEQLTKVKLIILIIFQIPKDIRDSFYPRTKEIQKLQELKKEFEKIGHKGV